ncbi:histidine acid phosphatase [Annulohypoxylon bovei var. microspora]|nr:histidine acid phosphatase [Annulohypoxylon bovei var. microspora]
MTSLVPRAPYTDDELRALYPAGLELQLVQVLLRHGERSPVSARFQGAGLPAFWPYCSAVRQLKSAVLDRHHNQFSTMEWKRRLETFGPSDEPVLAAGPAGELDGVCEMGMLTDKGRESTFDLGVRLRELYVDRLRFLPPVLINADGLYLRATPIPRALDSVQETFTGLYPSHTRAPTFPAPAILTRAPGDETLFPNDSNCRRFAALSRAFAQRAADRWNGADEMAYLTKLWGKHMPEDSPHVAVDSRPRLSGIMDTINSTLAHGPETRLPKEFYDPRAREIVERIGVEEWFAGYKESREYRALGIGGLLGDVVGRMVGSAERSTADGEYEVASKLESSPLKEGKGATPIRFGLSGCHDTTLAAVLASLGAYEGSKWPPYTSHIAIEMFRKSAGSQQQGKPAVTKSSWFRPWGSSAKPGNPPPGTIGRKRSEELSPAERAKLQDYYVRIRYNDEVVTVPGCKAPGKHLEGDESFCTLDAFKAIVDKFVPHNWKQECRANIKGPAFPSKPEPAGY